MTPEEINQLAFGEMAKVENVLEVVKQLWFLSGRYSLLLNDVRKTNPLEADMQFSQWVAPANKALVPYVPWLVRTYPDVWPEELRKLYGVIKE